MSNDYLNAFLLLFVAIDPIGLAPMFVALSAGAGRSRQRSMAVKGVGLAALILLLFTLTGNGLLSALGIGLAAFRIAGGILLFLLAIDMVFARQSGLRSATTREQHEAEHKNDISVFPLAFPLIAGPGSLTTVLLLTTGQRGDPLMLAVVLGMLAGILLVTLVALLGAARIMALLGETGANVVSRLLGLLLSALAVQFVLDGVTAVLVGRAG